MLNRLVFVSCLCLVIPAAAAPKIITPPESSYARLPKAPKGGEMRQAQLSNVRSFFSFTSASYQTRVNLIEGKLFLPLLMIDYDTYEFMPGLAHSYRVSEDHKTVDFFLHKKAKWSSGAPITAHDIVFTLDTIQDKKVDAGETRAYFVGVKAEATDQHTVRFHLKKAKFNSLFFLATELFPISKKRYLGKDINKERTNPKLVTSGPYVIKEYRPDQHTILKRQAHWWGNNLKDYKNINNFDTLYFPIVNDLNLMYEKLVKGDVDLLTNVSADVWKLRVEGNDKQMFADSYDQAVKTKRPFVKVIAKDRSPKTWEFINWNHKQPYFQSAKTRRALAHLVPFQEIIDKAYFGFGEQAVSPFGNHTDLTDKRLLTPEYKIEFNRKKAFKLLKEDGWTDSNRNGVLEKSINGKKVEFRFSLKFNQGNNRRKTIAFIVQKAFKKAGIVADVQEIEWTALINDMDRGKFDAFILGWGGDSGVYLDPRQLWHRTSHGSGGSNWGGYKNARVDKLIEQANQEFDLEKRKKIMQDISFLIYQDQPSMFLAERPYFMLFSTKLKAPENRYYFHYWPDRMFTFTSAKQKKS